MVGLDDYAVNMTDISFMHIHSGNTSPIRGPSFDIGGYAQPFPQ